MAPGGESTTTITISSDQPTAISPMNRNYGIYRASWKKWRCTRALRLGLGNIYLLGQLWDGILALKYQQQLKGLII